MQRRTSWLTSLLIPSLVLSLGFFTVAYATNPGKAVWKSKKQNILFLVANSLEVDSCAMITITLRGVRTAHARQSNGRIAQRRRSRLWFTWSIWKSIRRKTRCTMCASRAPSDRIIPIIRIILAVNSVIAWEYSECWIFSSATAFAPRSAPTRWRLNAIRTSSSAVCAQATVLLPTAGRRAA